MAGLRITKRISIFVISPAPARCLPVIPASHPGTIGGRYSHLAQENVIFVIAELLMHCAVTQEERFVKMPEALVWQHHLLINGGFWGGWLLG
jgi:hypothetical protein